MSKWFEYKEGYIVSNIVIIPARLGASRFPGKPMKLMVGMPMIGHCYFRSKLADNIDEVYVATCDQEIFEYVQSIGGKAIMTSDAHDRASTRAAEALEIIERESGQKVDIVVMVQGDEPLVSPQSVSEILSHFSDPSVEIANIMSQFRTLSSFEDRNNVKVVVNQRNDALYFSREPIPSPWKGWEDSSCFMQTGIIAFRKDALHHFNSMDETMLERVESIDMNRVLETGGAVRMTLPDGSLIGVDTPEELVQAEGLLKKDPVTEQYMS